MKRYPGKNDIDTWCECIVNMNLLGDSHQISNI